MAISCILLLGFLVLRASSEPDPRSHIISVKDSTNITTAESPIEFADVLLLLPANATSDEKPPMVVLISEIASNDSDPINNEVARPGEDDGEKRVFLIATLQAIDDNNTSANVSDSNSTSEFQQSGVQKQIVETDFIRKRRSSEQSDPLVRKKRTYDQNPCMICSMPSMIMGMIKKHKKKKKQPQYQQPPCGHPMSPCGQPRPPQYPPCGQPYSPCGGYQQPHYPPPPPQHPPPPPPPQYYPPPHPPQQSCNVCQGQGGYPPQSGSYSHSSSQSSAQSYSSGWGKK